MSLFLSDDELQELTEYKPPAKQIAWLRERRYPFEIGGKGRPRVLRAVVLDRLGGKMKHEGPSEPRLRLPR